ncbi:MAG: hypothetical protein KDC44_02530 [Phaeodactylibacter sp.]|nr:hypothetical protein [Phaeodactylibacter sp.]
MKDFTDHIFLSKCRAQIEEKLGWGSSVSWHNEVFEKLSDVIQESTAVRLSSTTLKRVWGRVQYQSAPSIHTLNTLSQFAGYTDWLDFKNQHTQPKRSLDLRSIFQRSLIPGAAIMIATLLIFQLSLARLDPRQQPLVVPDQVRFSSRPIAQGLPNTVVFDLDLEGLRSDSLHIQQDWDKTRTIQLRRGQKQATGIYYYPGYFRAKLLVDGQILKEHDLFIKSQGWLGTVDYKPIPTYLTDVQLGHEPLSFPGSTLSEIAALEKPHYSSFHWVDAFPEISADDFSLEAVLQNTYREKWAVCQTAKLVVLGTTGAMVIPFSIPGCVSDLGLMLNDVYLSGKEHDLSALGADFSSFRKIRLTVQAQQVRILLDDQELLTTTYAEPVGQLAGLRIRFLGAGEVQSLKLMDAEGHLLDSAVFPSF